jgi:hypothetical protein
MRLSPNRWSRHLLSVLLSLIAFSGPLHAQPQEVPESLRSALTKKTGLTLYSISPERDPSGDQFLGYPVLGEVKISVEKAGGLARAVLKGLEQADASLRQDCFAPRHALVVSGEKLLICYACHSVLAESKDGKKANLAITDAGHQELAQAVMAHRLPWQGWQPFLGAMQHRSGLAIPVPGDYRAEGAAGTETLSIDSCEQIVQESPMPGALVLRNVDGTEETVHTKWLDHSTTGKLIWYLSGAASTFEPSENKRVCRGSSYELSMIKTSLSDADKPARLAARVRVRPLDDLTDLKTQQHRLRHEGYNLHDTKVGGIDFKTAIAKIDGIQVEVFAGVVPTAHGSVLIVAKIPKGLPDPVPGLVRYLGLGE